MIKQPTFLTWQYPPPYELYNSTGVEGREVERLMRLEIPCRAVLDEGDEMIAFRCYGPEARVEGGDYLEEALDMGGGLRPDLTGRGFGRQVLAAALQHADQNYSPVLYRATVASNNHRAGKTCEHVGYRFTRSFRRPSDGLSFDILLRPGSSVIDAVRRG